MNREGQVKRKGENKGKSNYEIYDEGKRWGSWVRGVEREGG